MQIHGSCASRAGDGVLLIGPPGAGKSDLLLRLLARGFDLVADDRVDIVDGIARPVPRSGRPARGARPRHRAAAACRLGQARARRWSWPPPPRGCRRRPARCARSAPGRDRSPGRVRAGARRPGARLRAGPRDPGRRSLRGMSGERRRVVLVTGLSGGGKSSVLRELEDLGYEAVDNPPLPMLEDMVTRSERKLAIGVDARTRGFDADLVLQAMERLRANPALRPELVLRLGGRNHAAAPLHRDAAAPSAGAAGTGGRRHRARGVAHRAVARGGRPGDRYLGTAARLAAPVDRPALRRRQRRRGKPAGGVIDLVRL